MPLPSPAPPTGNRFATVTPTDHGAPIFIAAILSLIFALLVLVVRIVIVKWRRWDLDDLVLVCAKTVGLGQWISIFISYDNGLGKAISTVDARDVPRMAKVFFASRIFLVLALCLSKCSLLVTIRTIFTADLKKQWRASNMALAVVGAWGVASAFLISVNCSPNFVVLGQENVKCPHHVARLRAIFISEAVIECALVILPALFLIGVNMALKQKLLVVVVFALRLPTVPFIVLYLVRSTDFLSSGRTGVNIASTAIWQQVLLGYSLMSVTIPLLKRFVNDFTTGGMGFTKDPSGTVNGSNQNSHGGSQTTTVPMTALSKKSSARAALPETAPEPAPELTRSRSASHVSEGVAPDFSSVTSQNSRQMMIR